MLTAYQTYILDMGLRKGQIEPIRKRGMGSKVTNVQKPAWFG